MNLESGGEYPNHPASEAADIHGEGEMFYSKEDLGANYKDDWTSLQYNRFRHPVIKSRYLDFKKKHPTTEERNSSFFESKIEGVFLEKPRDIPKDVYLSMLNMDTYDHNLERVFRVTDYGKAYQYFKMRENLGASQGYGDHGVVFSDAKELGGTSVSDRSKNIIEAHEKVHGSFMNLTNSEKNYIIDVFYTERNRQRGRILPSYPNKKQVDEVLARMSQIKNYFGFKGDEKFTIGHLNMARKHYLSDVGFDNNMQEFFDSIDRENEEKFVELMNTIAC